MHAQSHKALILFGLVFLSGCASYGHYVQNFREGLVRDDDSAIQKSLDPVRKGPNRLLYLMERGLIAHYQGSCALSNNYFEQAENLADELYTRSISREVAAFLTNDAIRYYRGEPFELVLINYYRALNYWRLGLPEDALVECRKANLFLARYASDEDQDPTYRNDAFIHYMTGLLYEATGEWNDAYVSYREAQRAYRTYSKEFDVAPPPSLAGDLIRVMSKLGYQDDLGSPVPPGPAPTPLDSTNEGEVILFCETGFVPKKVETEIDLPILEDDIRRDEEPDVWALSRRIAQRHRGGQVRSSHLKYWLRVALPEYVGTSPATRSVRLSSLGRTCGADLAEDLSAIARRSFRDRYPMILTRTVARALSKYVASEAIEEKSKVFGFLANLFTASTEAADTRSWLSLPHSIHIARIRLPAGVHDLKVESMDAGGRVIDTKILPGVRIDEGGRTFLSSRSYK